MKKKIIISLFVGVLAIFGLASIGKTDYRAYYSGDAVNYQGNLIIASTDSGSLEVFKLNGNFLERVQKFKAPNSPLDKTDEFSSVKLNVESGRLFAYATSAYTLYKYDLSDVSKPVLFAKQKNTYYEWYQRVDKFGSYIVTVSDKNIRLWKIDNNTLDVVDSFKVENNVASAVRFDASGRYITTINQDNLLRIFDTKTRETIASFPVNYKNSKTQRKTYFDPIAKQIFVFDDYYLKSFDLTGKLLVSYPNSSVNGYAVEPAGDYSYVYVVNGDSIMKLSKANFRNGLKISARSVGANGFAMGLKYVDMIGQDRLVVFNGGTISVLNSSLDKIASIGAISETLKPEPKEKLALSFDYYKGTPGATVNLSGAGYLPNEEIKINFGGQITKITANSQGRFSKSLIVPESGREIIDAKVDGLSSGLTYSITFNVQKK